MRIYSSLRGWLRRVYDHPYNRQRPVTALRRLIRWHALRMSGRVRDLPFWGTRIIRCYPDADGSMWLILNEIMDWDEFHFLRKYLRSSDTFLDIGANLGIYTLWASQFIDVQHDGGRIVAFEPDPTNLARLREQIALNGLEKVEVASIALSANVGTIRFSQGKDGQNHVVTHATSETSIEVPSNTLDMYCAERNIRQVSFAKIDVEGAEQFVLTGAHHLLANRAINVIQLEFNDQVVARGLDDDKVPSMLSAYGYSLFRFDSASGKLIEIKKIDIHGHQNLLAIHDVAAVRKRIAEQANWQINI